MKLITLLSLAAASLAGTPALAADFTFEIPLTIENVPDGAFANLSCYVSKLTVRDPGPSASVQNVIGRAEKRVDLVNGSYHGKVVIEFSADAGKKPADGHSWKCYLSAIAMNRPQGGYNFVNAAAPEADFERITGLRVARLSKEFSGPLP